MEDADLLKLFSLLNMHIVASNKVGWVIRIPEKTEFPYQRLLGTAPGPLFANLLGDLAPLLGAPGPLVGVVLPPCDGFGLL
jgi:hypothetical protein